jgi:sortase A
MINPVPRDAPFGGAGSRPIFASYGDRNGKARRPPLGAVAWGLLLVGLACLGTAVAGYLDAALYQKRQGHRLEQLISQGGSGTMRHEARSPAAAVHAGPDDGLVGRIEIPSLGVSAIIAEGADKRTLGRAVGHLPETALPGDQGNIVLAGHRDTFFRSLGGVSLGDRILITTPRGRFEYEVDEVAIVNPSDVGVIAPTSGSTLTLVTCFPFHYIGPAPRRFIVRARPPMSFIHDRLHPAALDAAIRRSA